MTIVVPTGDLALLVDRWIDAHGGVAQIGTAQARPSADGVKRQSALQTLATEVARRLGKAPDTTTRTLRKIRVRLAPTTRADLADVVCLAMNDPGSYQQLPHFPTALPDAREMVAAYHWAADLDLSDIEHRRLARSLLNFSKAYLAETSATREPEAVAA